MSLFPSAFPPAPPAELPAPDQAAELAWQARRGVSRQWRAFTAALLDSMEEGGRDAALRRAGARMAALCPLPPCDTLGALEERVNDALAGMDWGHAAFFLDGGQRALVVRHLGAPVVATRDAADGRWIAPVLEGLHEAWLAGQTQMAPAPSLRAVSVAAGCVVLRSR